MSASAVVDVIDGYIDDRSQIQVHTDEQAQVHSVRSSSVVTHDPSTY